MIDHFEKIVRGSPAIEITIQPGQHPFDQQGLNVYFPDKTRRLFDDGHYSESVFSAFKHLENRIKDQSGLQAKYGVVLIREAFSGNPPPISVKCPTSENYDRYRRNFISILEGIFGNIRNPGGHQEFDQTVDTCLRELSVIAYVHDCII